MFVPYQSWNRLFNAILYHFSVRKNPLKIIVVNKTTVFLWYAELFGLLVSILK